MSLLEHLNLYSIQPTFQRLLEDEELALEADHSDWHYVDGEEGDYGVIRYRDATGALIAVKTVHGGDSEDFDVTPYGALLVKQRLLQLFTKTLDTEVVGKPDLS